MKKTLISLLLIAATTAPAAWAQDRIYRCGNEYTNNAQQAKERGCKLVEGGNVTVVQGSRPAGAAAPAAAAPSAGGGSATSASPPSAPRVSTNDQKARDSDARAILESELRKAEARHADLVKEYNGGAPERNALDLRNPQRYIERTAELKANITRSESDIAGIKREIARLPAAAN
ncbi:hypothetical protein ASF11_21280 [Acidovorax sp. Leaf76]|uniref:hypothetical protein n=1 Tax=unclassified Acidovorax TaxID=2684926 RepID=UPI0006F4FF3F|nr:MULTISPECIES: hypothetical protein [unclassified Acidovorax]KQO24437.1 hypothetical protein ASF11_21280 [Acidovorax sp. Leaf76]KQO39464.1 hypothetical protein ASF19_19215 [Acidovorax sp. Leaf84]KQS24629.1 hypothetical protein ASG27_20620 [Acidovorax sp. Leaf191]